MLLLLFNNFNSPLFPIKTLVISFDRFLHYLFRIFLLTEDDSDLYPSAEDNTLRDGEEGELGSDSSFQENNNFATSAAAAAAGTTAAATTAIDENAEIDAFVAAATSTTDGVCAPEGDKSETGRGMIRERNSGIHLHRSLTATDSQLSNARAAKDNKRLSLSK